jgi:anti-sigma factor RsiW
VNKSSKDLEEYLAAMADGEYIDPTVKQELESRLESDPELSAALHIQTAMKNMLHSKQEALNIQVPVDLRASIMEGLRAEQKPVLQQAIKASFFESFWNALDPIVSILSPKFAIPAIAAIGIAGYMYMSDNAQMNATVNPKASALKVVHAGANNICSQAYSTFHAYANGSLELQKISSSQEELSAFFAENGVTYPIHYPKIDADLIGGVVSQEKGTKFAHFIYKVGDHIIYAYEVPQGMVANQTLSINPRAMEIVNKADWYWEQENGASNTMVLWKLGPNLCVMVSDLRTEQLSALLHVEET